MSISGWQCIKCGLSFRYNLSCCPNCGYTVYRPLPTSPVPKVDVEAEREEIVEAMPYGD